MAPRHTRRHYSREERDKVKGVRGTWLNADGLADNFNDFNKASGDGLGPSLAAFQIFTGYMAKKKGFNKANVITNDAGKVVVEFTRGQ